MVCLFVFFRGHARGGFLGLGAGFADSAGFGFSGSAASFDFFGGGLESFVFAHG